MVIDLSKDIQLVSSVASRFLKGGKLRVVPVLGRGSVNKVFIVEATNIKLVVRLGEDDDSLDEYKKEAWCIKKAAAKGVPVATVFDVGVIEGHGFMIQTHIAGYEGRANPHRQSDIWHQLGKYARLIHSIEVAGFGLKLSDLTQGDSRESWLEYLNYNIDSLHEHDEFIKLKVVTPSQASVIRAILEDLKRQVFKFGLNHGDLSLKNVIVDESGKVSLIDWGSAEASMVPHHDLIQMLKMNMLENDPDAAAIHSFLDGYGISQSEFAQMMPTLESLLLLRAVDKLRWAIDQRVENLERFVTHARQALARKLC